LLRIPLFHSFVLTEQFANPLSLFPSIQVWFRLGQTTQYFFLRAMYFRASVEIVPSAEPFVDPYNPILKYLNFLLPVFEPSLGHLCLWVTHLLIQQGYPLIPRKLVPELLYLVGRNDGDDDVYWVIHTRLHGKERSLLISTECCTFKLIGA
jgi:hypothetical protein